MKIAKGRMSYSKLPIIILFCISLLSAYHANDSKEFFQQLKNAQTEVFEWLQNEFHYYLSDGENPVRIKRDIIAENGDDWYRNFECRVNNKSCSTGMPFSMDGHRGAKKISGLLGDVELVRKQQKIQSTMRNNRVDDDGVEKLQTATKSHSNDNGRINEKKMEGEIQHEQHLVYDVSDYRTDNIHAENSNSNSAINGLLNVRASIAAKQNEIHEIELKHQKHLTTDSSSSSSSSHTSSMYLDENLLNDNQLDEVAKQEQQQQSEEQQHVINEYSSNSNFHPNILDTSLAVDNMKRSSGQKQIHYDDQLDTKKNNLFDELKDMSNFQNQMRFNEPHHRVKRRDVINQINYGSEKEFDGLENSIDYDNDEMSFDNGSLLSNDNHQHVNTSAITTKQEMNNVNEYFSNDKSDNNETVNNNDETITKLPTSSSNNAKIIKKREIKNSSTRSEHDHLSSIRGKQKISDLISGELPNEIVKAANKLVNSNDILRRFVKPHLDTPKYSALKDSTKLSSIKINNMMSELVSYINELVNDQVQMRSCIPLTQELQDFYLQLMGKSYGMESTGNVIVDEVDDENSIRNFLMTKKKTKRNVKSTRSSKLQLIEKCKKVHEFHRECQQIIECKKIKPSLILYFKRHEEICEILKKSYETPFKKFKRSFDGINVSSQFAKLYDFRNYFLESKQNDL